MADYIAMTSVRNKQAGVAVQGLVNFPEEDVAEVNLARRGAAGFICFLCVRREKQGA
jgi:hypothetical protein